MGKRPVRKKARGKKRFDPFALDETALGKSLRKLYGEDTSYGVDGDFNFDADFDEPKHPLLDDRAVAAVTDHLEKFQSELWTRRCPEGQMDPDSYFEPNEGLLLRLPVMTKIIIDYLRDHPELLR